MTLPDPDDPRTGRLVGRWLQVLRAGGADNRTLSSATRALGQAVPTHLTNYTLPGRSRLTSFYLWPRKKDVTPTSLGKAPLVGSPFPILWLAYNGVGEPGSTRLKPTQQWYWFRCPSNPFKVI